METSMPLGHRISKLPAYAAGESFYLSSDVVYELGSARPAWLISDVGQSLGLWLLPYNVSAVHDPRFQQGDGCHDRIFTKNRVSPQEMHRLFNNVKSGSLCKKELDNNEICPICFECSPEQQHWRLDGLHCGPGGVEAMVKNNSTRMIVEAVVRFLPLISCDRIKLEDVQSTDNLVQNGGFKRIKPFGWEYKGAEIVAAPEVGVDPQNTCIKLVANTAVSASYISQEVVVDQQSLEPLVFSAWSKAVGVEKEYSVFVDFEYKDGSKDFALTIDFAPGTHEWENTVKIFEPPKPVARVYLLSLFRENVGTIYLDDIRVGTLSNHLCNIKRQLPFLDPRTFPTQLHPLPQNLAVLGSGSPRVIDDLIGRNFHIGKAIGAGSIRPNYFVLIWTSPIETFKLRHRRVIESLFFHHPDAHVTMYSNTLPLHFFRIFHAAGYDIRLERYNLKEMVEGLAGSKWVERLDEWAQGKYFYMHSSDFLRFLVLYKYGGIYSDMDSILLRPIELPNMVVAEMCGSSGTLCKTLNEDKLTKALKYYLPTGFMSFQRRHPLILKALSYFDTMYDPSHRHTGSIYLSLAYAETSPAETTGLKILPLKSFYPMAEDEISKYFSKDNVQRWTTISSESYTFHFWNALTQDRTVEKDSLVWHALNQFSISNQDDKTELQF